MTHLQVAHTADLDPAVLQAVRWLLDAVFEGGFDDHDWDHALGGLHALLWEDGDLVAHAAVVQRRMLYEGRALRCGYVEGVGVRAGRRRRGHGAAVLAPLEDVIRAAYDLGALGASDEGVPFYVARGWRRWDGPTSALTPSGVVRTAGDDGGVFVLPAAAALDPSRPLTCDWRDGEVW